MFVILLHLTETTRIHLFIICTQALFPNKTCELCNIYGPIGPNTLRTWKWSPTPRTFFWYMSLLTPWGPRSGPHTQKILPVHVPSTTSRTWKWSPTPKMFSMYTYSLYTYVVFHACFTYISYIIYTPYWLFPTGSTTGWCLALRRCDSH